MNFDLNEEQQLLQESVQKFVQNDYDFESRRKLVSSDRGYSEAHWQTFAELGWLGVPFAEADGGFGGGPIETMLLMQEMGKALVVEPYLATVVLFGGCLRRGGSPEQRERLLGGIVAGELQGALGFTEPQSRFNLLDVATQASAANGGYVLNGLKGVVLNGANADQLIVSARTSGDTRDPEGISLFLVDANAPGVERRGYPTVDGQRAAEVRLNNVRVSNQDLVGELGGGASLLQAVIDEGILAVGAEAVGCMEKLVHTTVEYSKNRKQFDQPIGQFQALQHRMVDMFIAQEQAKSMMYLAAMRMAEAAPDAEKVVAAFKVQVGNSARLVGQEAVQLHGGMGQTDELDVGHYFKRLTVIQHQFGDVDHHLGRFGAL